ncbi:MAG TPA: AAA family ATPase, partial [Myxococcota bacterium]|nr:AAA family ATPase [Myxococcota bacterium]
MNKFHLLDPTDKNHRAGKAGLQARAIPGALHDHHAGVQDYVLEPGLKVAVNTALALGSPLLLTGEPGTGKTHLAWYLNWYFGLHSTVREEKREEPYRFYTRSSSSARDLLWSFDTVRYFHDANIRRDQPVKLDKKDYREKGPLWLAIEQVNGGEPAVLLIDEIDKAPRDFPNDLLHELDQYHIRCTDTGEELRLKYPER